MAQYRIDRNSRQSAYLQLYLQLRRDITDGVYQYGDKLPSKRFLASETACSVITVQHAYELLADEGYIESRERSGCYVSYLENELFPVASVSFQADLPYRGPSSTDIREDFPFSIFARTMRRVLTDRGEDILRRSPNGGIPALREALSAYLARSRRINVSPDQIVIGAGSEYLYGLITQMLGRDRIYALENPSYAKIQMVYEASGVQCDLLEMDREGIKISELYRTGASVLHVTPFNSYPSGITASASRRASYIRWANGSSSALTMEKSPATQIVSSPEAWENCSFNDLRGQRFIVEDDFDSEFTMSTKAEDTLFSLEPNHSVIYMNTFSRTIASGIRVGYMVLPRDLSRTLQEKIAFYSCTVPVYTQYVLAEFIRSGDFERHINRVRRHRRQAAEE